MAVRFLLKQAKTRVSALGPAQARQEAIAMASVRAELGIADVDLSSQQESEPR
jgi:glycerol-3-phosphate dehydrogenase